MNAKDVIRNVIESCYMITGEYLKDLQDKDLFVRPVPGANHAAWQLGHLIGGSHMMLTGIGRQAPALPANFAAAYTKETSTSDDPSKSHKKSEYMAWMEKMRAASLAAVDATPDADLDRPGPESMREYAPTVGAVLTILGTHLLMHAGQFALVRRKLGRPPLF